MTRVVTEAMTRDYENAFRRLDVDGTHSLKREAVASVLCGEGTPLELFMIVLLFREYDTNGNGTIEQGEFNAFCSSIQNLNEVGILKRIFDMADRDKSGALDIDEVRTICTEIGTARGDDDVAELTQGTMDWLDRNNDNVVDFSEFCGLLGVVDELEG
jgi:Ca2+-binding EF-hand superfamily protein